MSGTGGPRLQPGERLESRRKAASTAFLASPHVPDSEWRRLRRGERNLHFLWTKRLIPYLSDPARVRSEHLSDEERLYVLQICSSIAKRQLYFARTELTDRVAGLAMEYMRSAPAMSHDSFVVEILVESLERDNKGIGLPRLSVSFRGMTVDVQMILEWIPQLDDARGTILLNPQARRCSHRFAVAAFNREQFAEICASLGDYIVVFPPSSELT